jgi:hypothetical protein
MSGPVGSGKSSWACFEFFFMMQEALEPLRFCVIRESYRQLHDSTRRTWDYWFGQFSRYLKQEETILVTVKNTEGHALTHELLLRHARRPEEASNFMSTEYAGFWFEEPVPALQVSEGVVGAGLSKEIFDMAGMRLRQPEAHRVNILLTFNPPHRYHWVYREFWRPECKTAEEREAKMKELGYALFRQPAYENEKHLRAGYYKDLLNRLDPELAKRFVLGEPVTMYPGERVFPEAIEGMHFVERLEPIQDCPLVFGFDFGLTPACLITQVLPSGRLICLLEIQLFNAGIDRLAEQLKGVVNEPRFKGLEWRSWGDPAGAQRAQTDEKTCFGVLAEHGFPVSPGAQDWESRRLSVKQRFQRSYDGKPGILIDSNACPTLSEGLLGGYRYPRASDGRILPRPLKNQFSHLCDALQYICTGEFHVASGMHKAEDRRQRALRAQRFNPLADPVPLRRGTWMGR